MFYSHLSCDMTSSFGGQFSFESTALDTSQVFTLELLLMKCPSLSPSRLQSLKYDSRASLTIDHNDRCLHHSKLASFHWFCCATWETTFYFQSLWLPDILLSLFLLHLSPMRNHTQSDVFAFVRVTSLDKRTILKVEWFKFQPLHYVKVEKWAKKCATLKTFFSMDVDAKGTKF